MVFRGQAGVLLGLGSGWLDLGGGGCLGFGSMIKMIPLCLLLGFSFGTTGCVMKYKNNQYDLETVSVSLGTGTFLPGANVVSTYKRSQVPTQESVASESSGK